MIRIKKKRMVENDRDQMYQIKKYQCIFPIDKEKKECGKSFNEQTNLYQHVRSQLGVKPFQCKDCRKKFTN